MWLEGYRASVVRALRRVPCRTHAAPLMCAYPRSSRRQTVASRRLSEEVNMAVKVITVPRTTMRVDPGDEARLLQEELNDNGPHMGRLVQLLPAVGEEDWLLAVFDVEDRSPETGS